MVLKAVIGSVLDIDLIQIIMNHPVPALPDNAEMDCTWRCGGRTELAAGVNGKRTGGIL
jgi:hypothetical protein